MAYSDHLEIIGPTGQVTFYDLNPNKGITNIGRHPENDIVIDSPDVALFHAVLDHRTKPYQIMVLADAGSTRLGGRTLPTNQTAVVANWDRLDLNGHSFILLEEDGSGVPRATRPTPTTPVAAAPVAYSAPSTYSAPPTTYVAPTPAFAPSTAPAPAAAPVVVPVPQGTTLASHQATMPRTPWMLGARPSDLENDIVLTELAEREFTVVVEQMAQYALTITNGGEIVATFEVQVQGVPAEWLTITPPRLNLNEGERATVMISITPPRDPTSLALPHHLLFSVSSPNYPGQVSHRGATLIIEPFYNFQVSDLSPKQQTIGFRTRSGKAEISLINLGNTLTPFRVEAYDDERKCGFEFNVRDEAIGLAGQTEVMLPPLAPSEAVQMTITPLSKQVIALRKRTYPFTVTTTMLEDQGTSRAVRGELKTKPLIGPGILLLILLLLLLLIALIFRPRINEFSLQTNLAGDPERVLEESGGQVTLGWRASAFANLRLETLGESPPSPITLEDSQGTVAVPLAGDDTSYKLVASNWLTVLSRGFFQDEREVRVNVAIEAIKPTIVMSVQDGKTSIQNGESIFITWEVKNAEQVVFSTNNGSPDELPSTEFVGGREVAPTADTVYTLVARNRYGDTIQSVEIKVVTPSSTPVPSATLLPTPNIVVFTADPSQVLEGESVTLNWSVTGVEKVSISGVPSELPATGSVNVFPAQTTTYLLSATNGQAEKFSVPREVIVIPRPTETPPPSAPVIEFFRVDPADTPLVLGDEQEFRLVWLVQGTVTNIEITSPDLGTFSGLEPEGSLAVAPEKTSLFVLKAFNGEASASGTVELKVIAPTATATLTPTPTQTPTLTPSATATVAPPPTPSLTPIPPPDITLFTLIPGDGADPRNIIRLASSPETATESFEVVAGTSVALTWRVEGADEVVLETIGERPANHTEQLGPFIETRITYQLTASMTGNEEEQQAYVSVVLRPNIPPPPTDLTGVYAPPDANLLEWDYPIDREQDILGYRIYRAPVTDAGSFERVAEIDDPTVKEWEDIVEPVACGQVYYVVAIYLNVVNNRIQETEVSPTSWASPPCSQERSHGPPLPRSMERILPSKHQG